MSAPQWKPGDVATIRTRFGRTVEARRWKNGWLWLFAPTWTADEDVLTVSPDRPLVVIDPEDREWKPGDVARIELNNGVVHDVALRLPLHEGGWATSTVKYVHSVHVASARPLVVIDPEAAEEFVAAAVRHVERELELDSVDRTLVADGVANALREFANPTPPRPEEPTGLGAVVEDADGVKWIRTDVEQPAWSMWENAIGRWSWTKIAAVKVLNAGWSE